MVAIDAKGTPSNPDFYLEKRRQKSGEKQRLENFLNPASIQHFMLTSAEYFSTLNITRQPAVHGLGIGLEHKPAKPQKLFMNSWQPPTYESPRAQIY